MKDSEWAIKEASDLEVDAVYYKKLTRKYGRLPVWVQAMREDLAAASRLRRLARL